MKRLAAMETAVQKLDKECVRKVGFGAIVMGCEVLVIPLIFVLMCVIV